MSEHYCIGCRTPDRLMHEVLARPERHHPSIVRWAQWRLRWLAQQAAGPSRRPAAAGETVCTLCLAATPEK
jgi:hypothetical protein